MVDLNISGIVSAGVEGLNSVTGKNTEGAEKIKKADNKSTENKEAENQLIDVKIDEPDTTEEKATREILSERKLQLINANKKSAQKIKELRIQKEEIKSDAVISTGSSIEEKQAELEKSIRELSAIETFIRLYSEEEQDSPDEIERPSNSEGPSSNNNNYYSSDNLDDYDSPPEGLSSADLKIIDFYSDGNPDIEVLRMVAGELQERINSLELDIQAQKKNN